MKKTTLRILSLVLCMSMLIGMVPGAYAAEEEALTAESVEETITAETEPAETEAVETVPVETAPAETEAAETEPAETEPAVTEPVETEPAETEPAETEATEAVEETVKILEADGENILAFGKCGANVSWVLDTDYHLEITGTGAMTDVPTFEDDLMRSRVRTITVGPGVTAVCGFEWFDATIITLGPDVQTLNTAFIGDKTQNSVLEKILVDPANPYFCNDDFGALYTKDMSELLHVPTASDGSYAVPEGVKEIADRAFMVCGLTSVTIPDSVERLGEELFWNCRNLESVTIGKGVAALNGGMFDTVNDCHLTEIAVSEENPNYKSDENGAVFTKDGAWLVAVPGGLEEYEIPEGTREVLDRAVTGNIAKVTVPESVTTLYTGAFWIEGAVYFRGDAPSVVPAEPYGEAIYSGATIFYPENNATWTDAKKAEISKYAAWTAYDPDEGVTDDTVIAEGVCNAAGTARWKVTADGTLTVYGTGEIEELHTEKEEIVKKLVIEAGITGPVNHSVMMDYTRLTSVFIGPDVEKMDGTIMEVGEIQTLEIDPANPYFCYGEDGGIYSKDMTKLVLLPRTASGCYEIRDGVEVLGRGAFTGVGKQVTELMIPASLSVIEANEGGNVFAGTNIARFYVNTASEYFSEDESGVLFNYDKTELVCYPPAKTGDSYTVPEGVTKIGADAFSGIGLRSCILPNGLKTIAENAFFNCQQLQEITIPSSVTELYYQAFTFCDELKTVYFRGTAPEMVSPYEGATVFGPSKATAYYPAGDVSWTEELRTKMGPDLNWVEYTPGVEIIGSGKCGDNVFWTLDSNGVMNITGTGAMTSIPGLDEGLNRKVCTVTIGAGITEVCSFMWYSATDIYLGPDVKVLNGFSDTKVLNSTLRGVWVDSANPYFFNDIFGAVYTKEQSKLIVVPPTLTGSYTVTNGTKEIGWSAFWGSQLTSVIIPDSVTTIEEDLFVHCHNLVSVSIGSGVNNLTGNMFDVWVGGCNLAEIKISAGNPYYKNDASGAVYTKDGSALIAVPGSLTEYSVQNGTKILTEGAVSGMDTNIAKVIIPEGVETLYSNAVGLSAENSSVFFLGDAPQVIPVEYCGDPVSADKIFYPANNDSWTRITKEKLCSDITKWVPYYFDSDSDIPGSTEYTVTFETNADGEVDPNGDLTLKSSGDPMKLTEVRIDGIVLDPGGYTYAPPSNDVIISANVFTYLEKGAHSLTLQYSDGVASTVFVLSGDTLVSYAVIGGNIRFDMSTGDVRYCDREVTAADIPAEINGVAVTGIGASAFEDCYKLERVTVPEGIVIIDDYAFAYCTNLTAVSIPSTVIAFGKEAFLSCAKLKAVEIPDGVISIGDDAFSGCKSLTNITIPASVTSIGRWAFNRTGLTDITIPNTVTDLGASLFRNCLDLRSVALPDNLKQIPYGFFSGCSSLTNVEIPENVSVIGSDAFAYCGSLTSIVIPADVRTIEYSAFRDCENLRSIYFDGSAPEIYSEESSYEKPAFTGVTATCYYPSDDATWTEEVRQNYGGELTWVPYPAGTIASGKYGDGLFWTLDADGVLTVFGSGRMPECTNPADVPWSNYSYSVKKAVIEDGIANISSYAFFNCWYLKEVEISSTVTEIEENVFWYNTNLTSIRVDDANPNYCSDENGILYNKDKTTLIRCPGGFTGSFTVPGSVKVIEDLAFYGCGSLSSISIPNGVETIGAQAFEDCAGLTAISIPASVTMIGDEMYAGCAFNGCSGLKTIQVAEGNLNYRSIDGVLYNKTATDLIQCPGGFTGKMVIPEGVKTIRCDAFYGCTGLTGVTIPESVTLIWMHAFNGCTGLETVVIPSGVTHVDPYTFYDCSALKQVTLPAGITDVYEGAFEGCSALTDVFYDGTEEDRAKITFQEGNESILNAVWHYKNQAAVAPVYRLYNAYSMEHLFVSSESEYELLGSYGWVQEGVAWNAPLDGAPVYRLYNSFTDGHFYTVSESEKDQCIANGWIFDGIVSYSAEPDSGVPIYRMFNPFEEKNYHHYTASIIERDTLTIAGWVYEGVAWYAASGSAAAHNFRQSNRVEATCTKDGVINYRCTDCGEGYQLVIPALGGHIPGDWVTVQEPTEAEYGLRRKSCQRCGEVLEEELLDRLESVERNYVVDLGGGKTTTVWGRIDYDMADEIFELLNEYRVENGLKPLGHTKELSDGANIRGPELAVLFEHNRPNGEDCFSVASTARGENIAAGYRTAEEVIAGWKASPGHNENMLRESFDNVGIGVFECPGSPYGVYCVQLFGK